MMKFREVGIKDAIMEVEILFVQDQKPYTNSKIVRRRAGEEKCSVLNNAYNDETQ